MRKIAVLTSGGDAPGMNATIRAVVRTALHHGWEAYGVREGYKGAINGDIIPLGARDVGGIIQVGGTFLGSARCPEFKTPEGREKALESLRKLDIDGLVVIGGNGSQTGAHSLHEMGFPVVGAASTIDNDLYGAEITLGVDTALNVALEAIDRLKVTASSHRRAFLLEVMGRDCGYLALMSGIAGGAEAVIIPEVDTPPELLVTQLQEAYERGKTHGLVVVAEGATYNANALENYFQTHEDVIGYDLRITRLGHVQRGGEPTAFDRILGSRLGAAAVDALARNETGVLVGLNHNSITTTPLDVVVSTPKPLSKDMIALAEVLAR